MQIFMSFYGGQLKQHICYSFILLISYIVFNPFEMAVQFCYRLHQIFPNFYGPNAFFPHFQQAPALTSER